MFILCQCRLPPSSRCPSTCPPRTPWPTCRSSPHTPHTSSHMTHIFVKYLTPKNLDLSNPMLLKMLNACPSENTDFKTMNPRKMWSKIPWNTLSNALPLLLTRRCEAVPWLDVRKMRLAPPNCVAVCCSNLAAFGGKMRLAPPNCVAVCLGFRV